MLFLRCKAARITQEEVEDVARQANAHDFITSFPEGYHTQVPIALIIIIIIIISIRVSITIINIGTVLIIICHISDCFIDLF